MWKKSLFSSVVSIQLDMELIERVEDQDRAIIRNSIKYLDKLTKIRRLNIPTLKSLYRTKCRLMELRRQIYLPQVKPQERCPKCFMNFVEGAAEFRLWPMKLTSFSKKVIAKVQKGLVLTEFQRIYYKKLKKKFPNGFQNQNKLVIKCSFCHHKTFILMDKPITQKKIKHSSAQGKKKKLKKKDKFCGLNESVVLQSSSQKQEKKINPVSANLKNAFTKSPKNNHNCSVSMTEAKGFQVGSIKPLIKSKNSIRIAKKMRKENEEKPVLKGVTKASEKVRKKNLNSLTSMLKKANEIIGKPQSKLKEFLASL